MENVFEKLTFRCSSLGDIVSESGKITQGVETKLTEIYYAVKKGFYKDFSNKYTEKGKYCEQASITMLQNTIFRNLNVPLLKNTERKYNAYIEGEHDVKIGKVIVDNKNCWDWLTLHKASLTREYELQLRGYMMLNDCDEAILFYSLLTPPEHIMQDLERKMFYERREWATMEDPSYLQACDELRKMYDFNSHPVEERFKSFHITRDEKIEDKIIETVKMCRNRLHQMDMEKQSKAKQNLFLMSPSA